MDAKQVIYERRATRDYTDEPVDEATVGALIDAAIQAPSGMDLQPWAFVVVQDRSLLKRISDVAQDLMRSGGDYRLVPEPIHSAVARGEFDVFYNAGTLIVICAKPVGPHTDWDCFLAGQNLMLAARSMGLGTCPIGFASPALELPEIRRELGIPEGYQPILPIVVGHVREFPKGQPRQDPEVLAWLRERELVES